MFLAFVGSYSVLSSPLLDESHQRPVTTLFIVGPVLSIMAAWGIQPPTWMAAVTSVPSRSPLGKSDGKHKWYVSSAGLGLSRMPRLPAASSASAHQ